MAGRRPSVVQPASDASGSSASPKEACPDCGGELVASEERRRTIKGGFATQKECQAALNKVLTAVDARTYVPPTRITVKAFLIGEWLPAVKGTLRPTTFASYTMLAKEHIIPRLGSLQLQKLTPASINALYAHLGEHGRVHGGGPLSPLRCAACTPSCIAPATTLCAGGASR